MSADESIAINAALQPFASYSRYRTDERLAGKLGKFASEAIRLINRDIARNVSCEYC